MTTLEYYNENSKEFFQGSVNADMSEHYKRFLTYLPLGSSILDLGCGSGRDTAYFRTMGYKVTPIDGSPEICKLAQHYLKSPVRCLKFEELDYEDEFDGIWACASLLHVKMAEMSDVLNKVYHSLKNHGMLYASYKYGNDEKIMNGRLFSNYNEDSISGLFQNPNWIIIETFVSSDVRPGRESEKWINVIVKKQCS